MSRRPPRTARFALALFLSSGLLAQATPSHADEPEPAQEAACSAVVKDGPVKSKHVHSEWSDGTPKSLTLKFVDGGRVQRHFAEDGSLKLETRRDVNKSGTTKRWHDNGQLFVCEVYVERKKTGNWNYFAKDGTPSSSFTYEDDKRVKRLTYSKVFGWQPFQSK